MALRALGLREFRVRWHGEIARIEVGEGELETLVRARAAAVTALKDAGFKFVSVDLEPFRSGRLNEAAGPGPPRAQARRPGGSGRRQARRPRATRLWPRKGQ